jgi:hypothetical protein
MIGIYIEPSGSVGTDARRLSLMVSSQLWRLEVLDPAVQALTYLKVIGLLRVEKAENPEDDRIFITPKAKLLLKRQYERFKLARAKVKPSDVPAACVILALVESHNGITEEGLANFGGGLLIVAEHDKSWMEDPHDV